MSRIEACFKSLRERKRKALIPFFTAGDPQPQLTVPLMHALVESGADILELGVPFSDPMADGPVIQRSSERALKHGVRLLDVIEMVRAFRQRDTNTPVVLMGYLNPVEILGYTQFAQSARAAGVDGVLTVDLPPEEAGEFTATMRAHDLDAIFLLAPTTSEERIQRICGSASGFVYYVSLKGVTGSDKLDVDGVRDRVAAIRRHTRLPVGVGFGIKDPESAAQVAAVSDAVVVGSAVVSRMEAAAADPQRLNDEVTAFLKSLRSALDTVC